MGDKRPRGHMRKFLKATLPVIAAVTVLVIGNLSSLWAGHPRHPGPVPAVPEIDPSSGMAAIALLAGAVLVIRDWRKK
jgi:hypothetical protein